MIKYIKIAKGVEVKYPESIPALKLFKYFSKFGSVSEFVGASLKDKRLVLPSLFSGNKAVCFANSLGGIINKLGVYNYLFFRDEGKVFCAIQHHNFISLVFLVDLSDSRAVEKISAKEEAVLAVTNQSNFFGVEKLLTEEFLYLAKALNYRFSEEGKVSTFIEGYQRPYHYFYDRLPWLIDFLKSLNVSRVESISGSRFIDIEALEYRKGDDGIRKIRYGDISIIPSKVGKKICNKLLASSVVDAVDDCIEKSKVVDFDIVIWIGLCEEKRPWPEKKKAITSFLGKLNRSGLMYHVFFDGLTRPNDVDAKRFEVEACQKEIKLLDDILESVSVNSYESLVGSTALDKLAAARNTDFFFTNGLTDSMWCAHFFRTPGLAYLSVPGTAFQHSHPKTAFIGNENIKSLEDNKNWARVGLSIDPEFVANLLIKDVLVVSCIKRNMSFRRALENLKVSGDIELVEVGGVFDRFKIGLGKGKKYLPLDGCDCGFSFSSKAVSINAESVFLSLDAEVNGQATMHLYAIFYSENGRRVEHLSVKPGEVGKQFNISEESKFFRLFYRFSGDGTASVSGFRLAPI